MAWQDLPAANYTIAWDPTSPNSLEWLVNGVIPNSIITGSGLTQVGDYSECSGQIMCPASHYDSEGTFDGTQTLTYQERGSAFVNGKTGRVRGPDGKWYTYGARPVAPPEPYGGSSGGGGSGPRRPPVCTMVPFLIQLRTGPTFVFVWQ